MRTLITLVVAVASVGGAAGLTEGQTGSPPPSSVAPAPKVDEKKSDAADNKMISRGASGRVKSSSADTLVVMGKAKGKDTEWTFALDAKTRIRKGGKDATAADLREGDAVSVRYTEHDGKNVAVGVMARAEAPKKADAAPADPVGNPTENKR